MITKREALQKQVFRPGHNLPTMTIEEYLDLEIARGNVLSGGTYVYRNLIHREPQTTQIDEDSEEATYKARQWDAFKDDNPAGWGNRYNKS